MIRKFSEKFSSLINDDVKRTILPSSPEYKEDLDNSDFGERIDYKQFKQSKNGFIEKYC